MGIVNSGYVSDHTRWMQQQLEQHPEWRDSQRQGRALWWDKGQQTDENSRFADARLLQKPYPYDTNF